MTLITAILTPDWVALAADRRLTWKDRHGRVTKQTDADTKIAVIEGEFLVGYTGVVPVTKEGNGFGMWITDLVRSLTSGPIIPFLKERLTEVWASELALTGQAFMLVAVGFTSSAFGAAREPQIVTISNAMNAKGDISPWAPVSDQFEVRTVTVAPGEYWVMTQGFHLDEWDLEDFTIGENSQELNAETADRLINASVRLHHSASADSHGTVGSATLVVMMGRSAFRSTAVSTNIGGDLVIAFGGGQGAGPNGGGPVNYEKEIVAHFSDPSGVETDKYPPAMAPTGRPSGARYLAIGGGRLGRGDTFLPPPEPLTA